MDDGILNSIGSAYASATATWLGTLQPLAQRLFLLLATIELIWSGIWWAFATRHDEIGVLQESFNTMTQRIQAHRAELRSAMEYLGGIVESSADMIITVTPDGIIETFNRGAEQALGYGRIEVIGRPVEILFAEGLQFASAGCRFILFHEDGLLALHLGLDDLEERLLVLVAELRGVEVGRLALHDALGELDLLFVDLSVRDEL